jgi:hypothetical protein
MYDIEQEFVLSDKKYAVIKNEFRFLLCVGSTAYD